MVTVMVVEDRFGTAAAVAAWLEGAGATVEKATNYAEAMATISYRQLAGGDLPGVVVGPLAKDGIAFIAELRANDAAVPVAFYSLTPSRDLDANLMRQHGLVAILHQPFASENAQTLFDAVGKAPPAAATTTAPAASTSTAAVPVPRQPATPAPAPAAAPPPLPVLELPRITAAATAGTVDLPAVPGDRRRIDGGDDDKPALKEDSRIGLPTINVDHLKKDAKPEEAKAEKSEAKVEAKADSDKAGADKAGHQEEALPADPPSSIQRLLHDPMQEKIQKEAELEKKKPVERDISMIAVDDRFNSAHVLVERLGGPGQFMKNVPSYREAYLNLDRRVMTRSSADLVVGPLSAEGVTFIKDIRKRGWMTAVVFYTESQTQSQDPKLPGQYGCLAIVRRLAMVEPLEKIVQEIRFSPIPMPPPAPPLPVKESGSRPVTVTTSAVGSSSGSSAATATGSTRRPDSDPPTGTRHRAELKSGEHRAADAPRTGSLSGEHRAIRSVDGRAEAKPEEPEIRLEPRVAKDLPAGPVGNARTTPRPGTIGEGPVTASPATATTSRPVHASGEVTVHPTAGTDKTSGNGHGSATGTVSGARGSPALPRRSPSGIFNSEETFLTPAEADKRAANNSRVRRSLGPGGTSDRLEVVGSDGDGSGSTSTGGSLARERLINCTRCKQDFFASVRPTTQAVLCTHCGATNAVEAPKA
jgi:CheY-like chemotaxis protein